MGRTENASSNRGTTSAGGPARQGQPGSELRESQDFSGVGRTPSAPSGLGGAGAGRLEGGGTGDLCGPGRLRRWPVPGAPGGPTGGPSCSLKTTHEPLNLPVPVVTSVMKRRQRTAGRRRTSSLAILTVAADTQQRQLPRAELSVNPLRSRVGPDGPASRVETGKPERTAAVHPDGEKPVPGLGREADLCPEPGPGPGARVGHAQGPCT